jgi:uncharacterized protein YcbK (DUF882 family)
MWEDSAVTRSHDGIDRRRALVLGAAALAGAPFARAGRALAASAPERVLHFENVHTDEILDVTYWREGRYLPDSLRAIDLHLRDFRTGDVMPIDRQLLDLLHLVNSRLENRASLLVISGYRSPATNAMLAARSPNVSKTSLHMRGMAIDVRLPGRPLELLRDTAIELGWGGVGYYPGDKFVHVDTGPVRTWQA